MPIIEIKSPQELAKMRHAGRIVAETLALLRQKVRPGLTTGEMDGIAETEAKRHGAIPAFKGYGVGKLYPASLCVSINEEVVHGIPSPTRVLKEGDIVSLDYGVVVNGYYGDAAITVPVGRVSPLARRLLDVTLGALMAGIAQGKPGKRIGDISAAIQKHAEAEGFSVVRQYVGHGIGRRMHEEPQVPNFGPPGRGRPLRPGMTLAIEPMVNAGTYLTRVLDDDWTVVTKDGALSAHFEHTIVVTEGEPEILTVA